MRGLMQQAPLLISDLIRHAARHHPRAEIVAKLPSGIHRQSYRETEHRAKQLAQALARLGVTFGDRVATLAWNSHRHVELYFAISGMGAVVNTINPRLAHEDIGYIASHAEDQVIFAELDFVPIIQAIAPGLAGTLRTVVFLCDAAELPALELPGAVTVLAYETLIAPENGAYDWPSFDENTASALCYTSGTTGKPKGVLYSHRSTVLQAMAVNAADSCGLRAVDRMMPVVPMFHVNAWSLPYAAAACGASMVLPGRFLDGASLYALIEDEHVTVSAGVPTVWLGVLENLRKTGGKFTSLYRLLIGGSACPEALFDAYGALGVEIRHAWGMSESSPIATMAAPIPGDDASSAHRHQLSQGRVLFGIDIRIMREGAEAAWDGALAGDFELHGHWVATGYYRMPPSVTADGWFPTGDVGMIDPVGFVQLTDRSKDLIKSGGEWISSIDLENIAVAHPAVREAAVIAAKHPKWDERPLLIVSLRPGITASRDDLLSIYAGKVAKWAVPDDVVIVDELPHGATGKLLKTALRAQFAAHLLARNAAE
jgi:fatty-acyl-CoA synthase